MKKKNKIPLLHVYKKVNKTNNNNNNNNLLCRYVWKKTLCVNVKKVSATCKRFKKNLNVKKKWKVHLKTTTYSAGFHVFSKFKKLVFAVLQFIINYQRYRWMIIQSMNHSYSGINDNRFVIYINIYLSIVHFIKCINILYIKRYIIYLIMCVCT